MLSEGSSIPGVSTAVRCACEGEPSIVESLTESTELRRPAGIATVTMAIATTSSVAIAHPRSAGSGPSSRRR
jgi:hypothetical protein